MQVRKRNGDDEAVDVNKIVRAVDRVCGDLADVDPMRVATRTISGLYDGATTAELDRLSIQTAAEMIGEEPQYSRLAARLLAEGEPPSALVGTITVDASLLPGGLPAVGSALAAVKIAKTEEGRELMARVLENAEYLWTSLNQADVRVVDPGMDLADKYGIKPFTPIVPIVVGEDWEAGLVWKELYDAGVYANVAMYPAVPRGGALLRTSVMATHERQHLDQAIEAIVKVAEAHPAMLRSS